MSGDDDEAYVVDIQVFADNDPVVEACHRPDNDWA